MVYKTLVKVVNTSNRQRHLGRFVAVYLMLALWLGTLALAFSPQLHRLLHQDSQNVKHECFVTQLSKASFFSGSVAFATFAPPRIELGLANLSAVQSFSASDFRLSPSSAPPPPGSSIRFVVLM